MAGRSPRHSQRGQSVRESAADIERYVSRGSNRAFVIVVFFAILALIFFVRLVFLQVIMAPEYSAQAQDSRTVGFYVEPRRGTIYDRNGHILAISVDATTVYVYAFHLHIGIAYYLEGFDVLQYFIQLHTLVL